MPADDDAGISPFAYVAGAAAADASTSPLSDPDAAALAAEAADDLAPLPDATGAPGPGLTAAGLSNTKGQGPSAASGSAAGVRFAPTTMAGDGPCRTNSRKGVKRKLIPLKQVCSWHRRNRDVGTYPNYNASYKPLLGVVACGSICAQWCLLHAALVVPCAAVTQRINHLSTACLPMAQHCRDFLSGICRLPNTTSTMQLPTCTR